MINRFLTVLDGSGKAPRAPQVQYFEHFNAKLVSPDAPRYFGMNAPPGIGKSFIARTIQRTMPNTTIITTNNLLVDQYIESYPDLNGVKGKDFYPDIDAYYKARRAARDCENVFNPLSFYYWHLANPKVDQPQTVVIDEAHKLADMLLLTIGRSLPCKYYGIPFDLTEEQFLAWLQTMVKKLRSVTSLRAPTARQAGLISKAENLCLLHDYLSNNLDTVQIVYEEREDRRGTEQMYITVRPIVFPSGLIQTIFGDAKLILLSGSLTDFDMQELFPDQAYDLKTFEPLAPRENRLVYSRSIPKEHRVNYDRWAVEILKRYAQHDQPNTLVHVTYGDSKHLEKALQKAKPGLPLITHDKESKDQALAAFKRTGGILLASGMAEGVDLPGDLCRLIIIPRLLFANKGDSAVIKRLALPNGKTWYTLNTMMSTLQQLGRGVRGQDDWCHSYILDCHFSRLISNTREYLTQGFLDSIVYTQ